MSVASERVSFRFVGQEIFRSDMCIERDGQNSCRADVCLSVCLYIMYTPSDLERYLFYSSLGHE